MTNLEYVMNPSWIAMLQDPIDVEDTDHENEEVYEIEEEEEED